MNDKLKQLTLALEKHIEQFEMSNEAVSKSTIGWQLEHIFLSTSMILLALKQSNPSEYKWSFKIPKLLVFTMGKIPRGRAKAPSVVIPQSFDKDSLQKHFQKVILQLDEIKEIDQNQFFNHPFFGNLKLKDTIRFLEIHTKHHSEIIRDIVKG
jgi:hypothetical protein